MSRQWHVLRRADGLTLCRHLPPRFDVGATTTLPDGHGLRLAHQIRQDIWRALQKVRGFSPVVELARENSTWHVTAGGRGLAPVPPGIDVRLQDVLDDPHHRVRWLRYARA